MNTRGPVALPLTCSWLLWVVTGLLACASSRGGGAPIYPDAAAEYPDAGGDRPASSADVATLPADAARMPIDASSPDGAPGSLFTPADNPFVLAPDEARATVTVTSGDLAEAQAQIDAARAVNPDAVVRVTLSGSYTVTSTPLRLPSRTCLLLAGSLRAAPGATAPALLLIDGQSKVSVSGGTLDGAGLALDGIRVQGSRKVALDGVTVHNCGGTGIAFVGPGGAVWDGGSTITRSQVAGCGAGIRVEAATRVLVLDGQVHDNSAAGITFAADAAHGAIVANRVWKNAVGIQVDGAENAISDNTANDNDAGIVLGAGSANNTCLQNRLAGNSAAGLRLAGASNLAYANAFEGNGAPMEAAGTSNVVVPESAALEAGTNRYFFPPTAANPHTLPTIVGGKGRFDVTVEDGSLGAVQAAHDQARAAHPDDVIVLHLQGAFTHDGPSLTLSSFTSLILTGTIDVTTGTGPVLAGGPELQFVSISGGTIDGHNQVKEGLTLNLGTLVVLDHLTVRNFGRQSPRSTSNSIHLSGGSGYSIVRGCRVDVSGGRGLWTQGSTSRFIVVGNEVTHANQDGIDFDSHTANSLAKDNACDGNTRYGLFIEEGAAFNKAYANILSHNGRGLNFYSNAAGKSSHQNLGFCNAVLNNRNGIRIGAINGNTTSDTFVFNNVVTGTTGSAILVEPVGQNNYFSANLLRENNQDLVLDPAGGADFFNSPPAPPVPPPAAAAGR